MQDLFTFLPFFTYFCLPPKYYKRFRHYPCCPQAYELIIHKNSAAKKHIFAAVVFNYS